MLRNTLILLSVLFPAGLLMAQFNVPSTNIYYNAGNVGIGTTSPQNTLHVNGTLRADGTILPQGNLQGMGDNSSLAWDAFGEMRMGFTKKAGFGPQLAYGSAYTFTIGQSSAADIGAANSFTPRLIINPSGNVGIGTSNPGTNRLAVEGSIAARKVIVTQANPFPDYVFQPNYPLLPLDSLHQYVRTNHHLPDIPSADSVARTGLDLGDNQAALLKKIEELTLYVIELNKKVAELQKQVAPKKKK